MESVHLTRILPSESLVGAHVLQPLVAMGRLLEWLLVPQLPGSTTRPPQDVMQAAAGVGRVAVSSWLKAVAWLAADEAMAPAVRSVLLAPGEARSPPAQQRGAAAAAAPPPIDVPGLVSGLQALGQGVVAMMVRRLSDALGPSTADTTDSAAPPGAAAAAESARSPADVERDRSIVRLRQWAVRYCTDMGPIDANLRGFEINQAAASELGAVGLGQLRYLRLCCYPLCASYGGVCEGDLKLSLCGPCMSVRYCSAAGQKAHWSATHSRECKAAAARNAG